MLRFHYVPEASAATTDLTEQLQRELEARKRVTWLVCGGSNIPLIVRIMRALPQELQSQLTIALTDERFGPVGHADSNWTQLQKAGFEGGSARLISTLVPNLSLADTCAAYETTVATLFENSDSIIAQFGIGADGHIAGILPHSSAVTEDNLVVGYDAGLFTRITLTPAALRHVQRGYGFVYGENKRLALEHLRDQDLPLAEQPAQILKQLPQADLYSDQLGDQS